MSQMAGFDFSVVTPIRSRPLDVEEEQRRILEESNAAVRNPNMLPEPVGPSVVDVAPEDPTPLLQLERPLDGAIEPNVQAVLDENVEPPLPTKDGGPGGPALPQADEDLPPVTPEAATVDGFDFSQVTPIQEQGAGSGEQGAAEGFDFSNVTPLTVEPEAKPLNLSFGGQEAAMAKAVMDEEKKPAPPVTTPEAADGTDVTFKEGDAPFKYTGRLVMVEGTGPTAGLDGMMPVTPAGPVADAAMAGPREPVMNRQPRLVPDGGQIVFDQSTPERFTEGVERAFESGLLPQANYEKIKANTAAIFKVVDDRRKLEAKAQADPRLLAVLQGVGRGGAMTAGAIGGAVGLAKAGTAGGTVVGGPVGGLVGGAVGGVVGGIGGGIAAGVGYDALYKQLGKHFEEYDNVMRAAELYPQYKQGGELSMAAVSLGAGAVQGARGLINTAQGAGGLPAAARQAAVAGAAGAGTGVVAYPIDAAVRGEEITPGGFAAAAGMGVLGGGFFINNRLARTPEIAAVFAKAQRGQKLTSAEEQLFKSAYGPIESAVRRGQVDGQRMADIQAETPVTSVAGFMPAAGRTQVTARYQAPMRLPEGALRAAQAMAQQRRTAGPAVPTGETAAPVPRTAPVNVLPTGETIVPPPPMTPAMMTPDDFAMTLGTERGIDMDFNPDATTELFNEHFRIVREAINNNEPVSAAALDLYEMRVPYYVRDEATGLARFDQASFDEWGKYVQGQEREARESMRQGGVDLLDAIRMAGGLPTAAKGKNKAGWSGELKRLQEMARGARDLGIKQARDLFRKDANDVDRVVMALQAEGFKVETEADLFELLEQRLRSGKPMFAYGDGRVGAADELPSQLRGRRPAPGSPRQMDLLGESDVEFTLQGQADKTSLTPQEQAAAAQAEADAAAAAAGQGDLFGESPAAMQRMTPEEWAESLPSSDKYLQKNNKTDAPYSGGFQEGELLIDKYGEDPYVYRAQYIDPRTLLGNLKLEGMTYDQVVAMPTTQQYIKWYRQGNEPPPVNVVVKQTEAEKGQLSSTNRRRVVAAIEAGVSRIPALVEIGRRDEVFASMRQQQPAVSSDPLTPPAQVRSGGGAKVPPGAVPVGMAAVGPPDWVLQAGETSQGRRLIKGISKFKLGQQWAYGDIITMVRRAIGVESRRSRSQTTPSHPAHYRPQDMIEFTRDPFGQVGFHEAGHQLQYMLQARVPGIWQAHETELLGLTQRPGSMASEPPDGATPRQKHIYRVGEGVAEWLRLLVTDPAVVERMPVSQTIQAATDKHYPGISRQVRDAVRAMNAFQSRPAVERAAMLNNVPREQVTLNAMWSALIRGKEAVGNMIASGAAFDRLPRKVFRLIMKDRKQTGMTYREAVRAARAAERQLNDIPGAYNYILGIGEEAQLAISGKGAAKGLRMQKPDGSMEYLTRWTWDDLRERVPAQHLELFDMGAWAFESSERWVREGIEYTGMREGMTPDDLLAIVKQAKDAIPAFGQLFAEQSNFLHTVLEMKEYGQILSREERERVQYKRDAYWPLPEAAVGSAGGGGRTGATINKGVFRAFGHAGPTAKIDAVVVDKVTDALTSVAWNNLALVAEQRANAIAKDTSLPWEARQFAGSLFTEMQMPMSKVAELNFMEKAKIKEELIEAVATAQAKVLGFKPDIDPDTVHVAWTFKDIWRPIEPGDVQIWARFKDGKRSYVQVGDPSIYAVIGAGKNVNPAIKLLKWAFGPASRNMQTAITESPGFAVPSNLVRDVIQQLVTNTDSKFGDWIPGGSHVAGLINKFTQKYPQVFREGLLLNRDVPTREQLVKRHQQASLWQFLTDGFYVSNAKNPTVRLLGTIFNPSNMLFYVPVWPVVKIANAVAPGGMVGLALGGAVGGPVGAAIGAAIGSVAGPLSGFTGKGIATFTEEIGREGNAVRVLQRGGTDAEAMQAYWFRTGQFNEHPGNPDLAALLRVAPFANPALQSTRNLVQVLTHPDPAKRFTAYARLAQIAGMAAVAALIKYLMMDRNDRQKERERTIQDRMGYMDMAGMRVPFAYGLQGGVQSLVYNAVMDDLLARETDWDKGATMLAKRVFDPQGMMNIMGPQVSSLFELRRNWSEWRQTNIVAPWMLGLPASDQYYSTTPEFYRKLGSMMEWSPVKIQYFVQQGIARQIDDTIRLAESVGGGKPMQEAADLPFVGRIFVRDPIGFASASVQKINDIEGKLQTLNARLNAKGWGFLNSFDRYGNPTADASKLSPDLQRLQMQLGYLHQLRQSINRLDQVRTIGEAMRRAGNYVGERNARVWQTHIAQATLAGNADRLKVMDAAIEAAQQLDPAPPEQMAADYLQRRF